MMTAAREQRLSYLVARRYDAQLWLVHKTPNGSETVQEQTVHFGGPGAALGSFAFPQIQVQTSRGPITIDITGKLQSSTPTDGRQMLAVISSGNQSEAPAQHITVSIDRRARSAGPPLLDITGGSSMVIEVPKPTDVLSFEFPALQKSTEDLLKGHQFSLRVQLTPSGR